MQTIISHPAEATRDVVAVLYEQRAAEMEALISAWLAPMDRGEAEDLAQDVWVAVWELAAAGADLTDPAELLRTEAGRVVAEHYTRTAAEVLAGVAA